MSIKLESCSKRRTHQGSESLVSASQSRKTSSSAYSKEWVLVELRKHLTSEEIKSSVVCLKVNERLLVLIGLIHGQKYRLLASPFKEAATSKNCAYFKEGQIESELLSPSKLLPNKVHDFKNAEDKGYFYGIEESSFALARFVENGIFLKVLSDPFEENKEGDHYKRSTLRHILNSSRHRKILKELADTEKLSLALEIKKLITTLKTRKKQNKTTTFRKALSLLPSADQADQWFKLCHFFALRLMEEYNVPPKIKKSILNALNHPGDEKAFLDLKEKVLVSWRNESWQKVLLSTIPSLPPHVISLSCIGTAHLESLVRDLKEKSQCEEVSLGRPHPVEKNSNKAKLLIFPKTKQSGGQLVNKSEKKGSGSSSGEKKETKAPYKTGKKKQDESSSSSSSLSSSSSSSSSSPSSSSEEERKAKKKKGKKRSK